MNGYGFTHAARSEWIKLRSLRSTMWALVLTVACMISIGILTMSKTTAPETPEDRLRFDPTNDVLAGMALGQLIVGAIGVLMMTSEYSSGSIRSTLAAIPRRPLLLAAKAAVLGTIVLALGEIMAFATFFTGRMALGEDVPAPSLGDPGVLRAVALGGAYLALVGLLGVGFGAILRHTAGAIGAVTGVVFVLSLIAKGIVDDSVVRYLPTMIAADSLAVSKPVPDMLSPWTGLGMMCLYVVVTLGAGGWLLARRDA